MTLLLLLVSLVLIVGGAVLFTNAVEWLGQRLNLGQGAVGSLLAAVGTALPESTIPIVALIAGTPGAEEVAIGAVIGAPFMLATVAMLLVAGSAVVFKRRRKSELRIEAEPRNARRDLLFFLACFSVALVLALGTPRWLHVLGAIGLVAAYVAYSWRTVRKSGEGEGEEALKPLVFDTSRDDPPNWGQILLQLAIGLAAIIGGAELFVEELIVVAEGLGVTPLVLSLILAPLATELPEKFNSVIWMRRNKDGLAVGNITGAMVFQATLPVALLMLLTEWTLDAYAIAAGVIALVGGALALVALRRQRLSTPFALAWAALFVLFVVYAATF